MLASQCRKTKCEATVSPVLRARSGGTIRYETMRCKRKWPRRDAKQRGLKVRVRGGVVILKSHNRIQI
eukprot:934343-Prymnesium_polylepis.1